MSNYVLHVRYTVKPGMRNAFVKDVLDSGLLDEVRRENGCLEYCYYCSRRKRTLFFSLKNGLRKPASKPILSNRTRQR